MGKYQGYFRKLDNFFSGKQQGALRTDQKIYLLIYDFCKVVTIFKAATSHSICSNNSNFFGITEKANENYKI